MIRLAIPVMLAQVAIAATGVVDTTVMGLRGSKTDLAAVAVASVAFSFVYWAFGFLRLASSGVESASSLLASGGMPASREQPKPRVAVTSRTEIVHLFMPATLVGRKRIGRENCTAFLPELLDCEQRTPQ